MGWDRIRRWRSCGELLIEAMMLSAPLLIAAVLVSLAGEPGADVDQCAGADVDGGTEAGGGVCRHGGGDALDGASAGEFHGAFIHWLSQVPGIEAVAHESRS